MRLLAVASSLLVWACSPEPTSSIDGAKLFGSYCASCHGPRGKPDQVMAARLGVRDLTARDVRMRLTPELVESQIRNGSQNKQMPSFSSLLGDPQIKALAAYVTSPAFVAPANPAP
ncbi:MAG: cytochrome c [Kofleriaceae bacterium]